MEEIHHEHGVGHDALYHSYASCPSVAELRSTRDDSLSLAHTVVQRRHGGDDEIHTIDTSDTAKGCTTITVGTMHNSFQGAMLKTDEDLSVSASADGISTVGSVCVSDYKKENTEAEASRGTFSRIFSSRSRSQPPNESTRLTTATEGKEVRYDNDHHHSHRVNDVSQQQRQSPRSHAKVRFDRGATVATTVATTRVQPSSYGDDGEIYDGYYSKDCEVGEAPAELSLSPKDALSYLPENTHSIHQQLNDIWMTVQLQAVWRPMVTHTYTHTHLPPPDTTTL
jgi:hypothetical protein